MLVERKILLKSPIQSKFEEFGYIERKSSSFLLIYLNRVVQSALRLVSIGALHFTNNTLHQEFII